MTQVKLEQIEATDGSANLGEQFENMTQDMASNAGAIANHESELASHAADLANHELELTSHDADISALSATVGGHTANLGQLNTITSDQSANINNLIATGLKPRVATQADLPTSGNMDGDIRFSIAEGAFFRWQESTASWVQTTGQGGGGGEGGDTSALEARIAILENETSSMVNSFTEDFITQNKVDLVNTDATVGTGYVRTEKLATFTETFDTTNDVDLPNSTNINVDTASGKLTLSSGNLSGLAVSKTIPTAGSDWATVDAVVTHRDAMAFSDVSLQSTNTSEKRAPSATIDRIGRRVYVWFEPVFTTGKLYLKIYDTDNSLDVDVGVTLPYFYTGFSQLTTYNNTSIVVDYNNRIWVQVTYKTNHNNYGVSAIICFNSDGTIFMNWANVAPSPTTAMSSGQLFLDRNGRIWAFASRDSGGYAMYLAIYNSDGTVFLSPQVTTAGFVYHISVVYDSVRDRVCVLGFGADTNLYGVSFDLNGNMVIATKGIDSTGTHRSCYGVAGFYNSTKDAIILFSRNIYSSTVGQLNMFTIKASDLTLATTNPWINLGSTINSISANSNFSGLEDAGVYYLAYASLKESATYENIHFVGFTPDGVLAVPETLVTSDANYADLRPAMIKRPDNNAIEVLYDTLQPTTNRQVYRAVYTATSTTVDLYVSNDDGLTWLPATPGQQVNFPSTGNQLKVKLSLNAPVSNPTITPDILEYTLTEGTSQQAVELVRNFITTTLPAVMPVSKITVSATQDLSGGGSINWYASNNGGNTWYSITLGQQFSFPTIGSSDLRLKAVLTYPTAAISSPKITGYTALSQNTVTSSELNVVLIDLMKTNFKVQALQNVSKYALKNMVIEDYNDASGINASASSGYTYDAANKRVQQSGAGPAVIVSTADAASLVPMSMLLTAEYTLNGGTATFEISRDNGTTFLQVTPDVLTDISSLPSGSLVVSRVTLTGGATITSLGYAWK